MKSRLLLFSLVSSLPLTAADFQWDPNGSTTGLGGAGTWDTTSLFWDATATGINDGTEATTAYTFTNADTAVFGGTAGTVTLGTGVTVNGLRIDTAGYVITGNTLTLAGTTPKITANANASISSELAGNAGLVKAGTGNLTISGANTFSGGINLDGGNLKIGNISALGTGTLTVATTASTNTIGSAMLDTSLLTLNSIISNAIVLPNDTVASNRAIYMYGTGNGTNTLELSGKISGGSSFTTLYLTNSGISGNPQVTFSNSNNDFRANVLVWKGGIRIASNEALGNLANTVKFDSYDGADLTFLNAMTYTRNTELATGTDFDTGANNVTASGVISGADYLSKIGSGTLTLSGTNTYTGVTNVNAGTVKVGNITAFGAVNTAVTKVVVASGATVDFNGQIDATYGYTISGTGVGSTGALTNSGAEIGTGTKQATNIKLADNASIGGSGNWALLAGGYGATSLDLNAKTLTKVGSNTVSLVNTTTTAGTIQVSGGTLALGVSGTVNGSASAVTLDNTSGANLSVGLSSSIGSLAGGGTTGGNTSIANGATLTVGALNTNTTYSGVISGGGLLAKTGAGILTLSGTNTFTGTTTISGGTLQVGSGGATGSLGSGAIVNNANLVYNLNTSGTASLPSGGITGSGDLSATAGVIKFNGNITQGGALSLTQVGTASLYKGLELVAASTTLTASSITLSGDVGKANSDGNSLALNTSATNGTINLDISLGRDGIWYIPSAFSANAGTGAINITGSGLNDTGWRNTPVTLTGAVNMTGNVNSSAAVTINATANGTVSGAFSGGMSLTKSGAGTMTLSAINTYTGATTVSAGTLAINGDQSAATGAVSVAAGATNATAVRLKGIGTVGGNTAFAADPDTAGAQVGGIHSPGNSVGKQTFDASGASTTNLTYNTGSIFEWELASTPAATNITKDGGNLVTGSNRGVAYDAVNVTGTLGGSGAIFRVVLDGTQDFSESFWTQQREWTDIFRTADHVNGQVETASLNIASIFTGGFQYYNYSGANSTLAELSAPSAFGSFTISGSTLTWSAVPEPTSALVGLLIGAGLLRRRRN